VNESAALVNAEVGGPEKAGFERGECNRSEQHHHPIWWASFGD